MRPVFARAAQERKGNVAILFGLALPLVVGGAGLATDAAQWSLARRELQEEADSAALSAGFARAQGASTTAAASKEISAYSKVALDSTTVENPPSDGSYSGDTAAVRVTLASTQKLPFSSLFLSTPPVLKATATSKVVSFGQYCVLSLDGSSQTGITATGSASLDLGCGMASNSSSSIAIDGSGAAHANVTSLAAVGQIPSTGVFGSATIYQNSIPQPDPYASLPTPSPSGCANNSKVNSNQNKTLSPGCYSGLDIQGNATLLPGVYYIDGTGGDLNIGAQATLSGTGVTIILTSTNASTNPSSIAGLTVNAGATINLSATTTGTYAGVLIAQDRRAPSGVTNKINGNSSSALQGAIYFPSQSLLYNGTSGMQTQCLQMVAANITFSGNSTITNTCPTNSGAHAFSGAVVQLVE